MTRANLALAGAAAVVALVAFVLVRGVQRMASAEARPSAPKEDAPQARTTNLDSVTAVHGDQTELAPAPTIARREERSGALASKPGASDPVQGIVWGHVLDPAGKPIDEAWLAFLDGSGEQHSVAIDERGAYSIAGLAPGTWWASAGSIEYRKQEESLEIPPAPSPLRKDFVLRAVPRIDVQLVAPDGRPYFEAAKGSKVGGLDLVPVATREPPGERFYEVEGSLNNPFGVGSFWENGHGGLSLPQGFWGSVLLDVDPPVYASLVLHHLVLSTQRVETSPAVVTFALDPAAIETRLAALHLSVVDARSGAPLSGGQIHLGESHVLGERTSDASGEIALDSLMPGRDELRVMAEGFVTHRAEIELEPGITNELGPLALEPEVLVSGTVSGPDGAPLEAEFAVGRLQDDGTLDLDQLWVQSSDAAGRFELHGLPAARHVLQVNVQTSSPRYRPNASFVSENVVVDTRPGPVEGLAIQLAPASRVAVRWAGADRESLWLRFLDERGLLREWGRFYSAAPQRFALPPGRWKLDVLDRAKQVVAERTFDLADTPLELVLGEPPR